MGVCEHCGLNIDIFEIHAPGCPLFSEKEAYDQAESTIDMQSKKSKIWSTLIEVSSERGESLAKSVVINGITGGTVADESIVLDDTVSRIITVSSWAGVMGALQVFAEQGFFDVEAIQKYLSRSTDDII